MEPQLLVEAAWLRAARQQEQAPGEWVLARPPVPQVSLLPGYLPTPERVLWEQFSGSRGLRPERRSREWQGQPAWLRVGPVRSEPSAWQRLE